MTSAVARPLTGRAIRRSVDCRCSDLRLHYFSPMRTLLTLSLLSGLALSPMVFTAENIDITISRK